MTERTIPRLALAGGLTGLYRGGLTMQLPVLSCMGIQACPFPTASASAHAAFPDAVLDAKDNLAAWVKHWVWSGVRFDGLLTGEVFTKEQAAQIIEICEHMLTPGAPFLLNPSFADDGKLYAARDAQAVEIQRNLCGYATIITPNLTEACMLTKTQHPHGPCTRSQIATLMRRMLDLKSGSVVITGIPIGDGQVANVCASVGDENISMLSYRDQSGKRIGTDDFFAATLLGRFVRGISLTQSMIFASGWTSYTAERTANVGTPAQDGLLIELVMPLLATTGSGSPVDAENERTVQFLRIDE